MAWTKSSWSYSSTDDADLEKIRVYWTWVDTVDATVVRQGTFEFTLTAANSWTVNKAAIQTKIDNGDGAER